MDLLQTTIFLVTVALLSEPTLVQCQRRVRMNPLASAMLQNILSPSNTEGALQLLKMAAGAKGCQGKQLFAEQFIAPNALLQNTVLQNAPCQQKQVLYQAPRNVVAQQNVVEYPVEMARLLQNVPVAPCGGPVAMVQEKPCPCSTPAPLVNPFLPAASPVSAIAPPVSSMLPPANLNSCRCNFLRKIPIPPPTL